MNETLFKITSIYRVKDRDWMNYRITKKNSLTYHHIVEKRNGGSKTVSNGAPLTKEAHMQLNIIESKDKRLYTVINTIFKLIHEQNHPITEEQRRIIREVLDYFESETCDQKKKLVLKKWRDE